MKQANDTVTPELHLDGQPVFDLDHDAPWPMPPVKAWVPRPAVDELSDVTWGRLWPIDTWTTENDSQWGSSIVATPAYRSEQARLNAELREELEARSRPHDPAAEPNPIAAAFTRLMTWSQR